MKVDQLPLATTDKMGPGARSNSALLADACHSALRTPCGAAKRERYVALAHAQRLGQN